LVARGRVPAGRTAVIVILVAAAAMRLALAVHAPALSNDVYRYVWDGRVQAHGINPYRYAPADGALAPLRDRVIYDHVSRRGVPTIYPPVAELAYRTVYRVHRDSVVWTKLAFSLVDLGSGMMIDRATQRAWSLPEEPTIAETVASGADLVTFSGGIRSRSSRSPGTVTPTRWRSLSCCSRCSRSCRAGARRSASPSRRPRS